MLNKSYVIIFLACLQGCSSFEHKSLTHDASAHIDGTQIAETVVGQPAETDRSANSVSNPITISARPTDRIDKIMALCGLGISETTQGIRTNLEKHILSVQGMTSETRIDGFKRYLDCVKQVSDDAGLFNQK